MSKDAVAETLGAHVAISVPSAEIWHRVALGRCSYEQAVALVLEGRQDVAEAEREELERARLVFAPPSEEHRAAQLERLLAWRVEEDAEGLRVVRCP